VAGTSHGLADGLGRHVWSDNRRIESDRQL
jgi:hypothetical protein